MDSVNSNSQPLLVRPDNSAAAATPAFNGQALNACINPPAINPWIIALTVTLATFMEVLDTSVANVALPHIAGSLSASTDESTWVLTSYLVSNAIVLPHERLVLVVDRAQTLLHVVRRVLHHQLLPLRLSSESSDADCVSAFCRARAVAGCSPASRRFWRTHFRRGSVAWRSRCMAWRWCSRLRSAPLSAAGSPTILVGAGFSSSIFQWASFRCCSRTALITDPPYMRRENRKTFRIDYIGLGLLALGLGALQVVLDKGERDDWFGSHFILITTTISISALIAVVVWEWKHKHPIIDLHLFKDRSFAIGNLLMFMVGFALMSSTVLIPLFLQTMMGYTAQEAGLALMPGGFAIILVMPLVGFLLGRYDARRLLLVGFTLLAVALFYMTHFNLSIDFRHAALARLVQALGLAFLFVPINTAAYAFLPKDKNNAASGLINLSRNVGGSVGISVVTTMLSRRTQFHLAKLSDHVHPGNAKMQAMLSAASHMLMARGSGAYEASHQAYALVSNMLARQATMLAYVDDFWLVGVAVVTMIPFVFLMKKVKPGGPIAVH